MHARCTQSGLAFDISMTRFRVSGLMGDLPSPFFRDLNLQNSWNPFLCQRISLASRRSDRSSNLSKKRMSKIQKIRSLLRILGLFIDCRMKVSC